MIRKKETSGPVVIDLTGPAGNAFNLMGQAQVFGRTLNYTKEELTALMDEMKSSDYENLIKVFDNHFGSFVILER